jgi:hypothetical protein
MVLATPGDPGNRNRRDWTQKRGGYIIPDQSSDRMKSDLTGGIKVENGICRLKVSMNQYQKDSVGNPCCRIEELR